MEFWGVSQVHVVLLKTEHDSCFRELKLQTNSNNWYSSSSNKRLILFLILLCIRQF